ncbi:MAG: TerB family tellurite resistance protein [Sulfurospirillaceae bacterium]|nr:TerB family tellurite resistance protein [Sulfurospirillaceae bacterium]
MKLRTEEKFAFLQLCQYVAKADGEYSPKERLVIAEYCSEMGIDNIEIDQSQFMFDENLAVYTNNKSQKIVMLSLMVLVHIDHKFGIYEHKSIAQIAAKFDIQEKELQYLSMWGKAASAMFEQALILIEE